MTEKSCQKSYQEWCCLANWSELAVKIINNYEFD